MGIRAVESGPCGDVGEGPVSIVVVQRVASHSRDEQVGKAVVVVVRDRRSDIVAGAPEPGLLGDVRELPPAVVPQETVPVFRGVFAKRADIGAVREEQVGLPIAVVIEDRQAASHGGRIMLHRRFRVLKANRKRLE